MEKMVVAQARPVACNHTGAPTTDGLGQKAGKGGINWRNSRYA